MRLLLAIVIGALLVGGAVIYFYPPTNGTDTPTTNEDGTENQTWQTFSATVNQALHLSVTHPTHTTIARVQDTIYEITYVGPQSEPNTEITDGYFASLVFSQASNLERYVAEQYPDADTTSTVFNGQTAVTFTSESELGDRMNNHVVYLPLTTQPNWVLDITFATYGTEAAAYTDELMRVLRNVIVTESDTTTAGTTTLRIAMLDYDQTSARDSTAVRGCDHVVFIETSIPATTTPLNAALQTLFSYDETEVAGWHNFIAQTNDTLFFDEATLEDGVASIYLTGSLSGLAGVCDNPRARIQIEETALQFDTIDEVVLYLNGQETELQPSGRGT